MSVSLRVRPWQVTSRNGPAGVRNAWRETRLDHSLITWCRHDVPAYVHTLYCTTYIQCFVWLQHGLCHVHSCWPQQFKNSKIILLCPQNAASREVLSYFRLFHGLLAKMFFNNKLTAAKGEMTSVDSKKGPASFYRVVRPLPITVRNWQSFNLACMHVEMPISKVFLSGLCMYVYLV